MKDKTTEFSFMLKPAGHGVGVFATQDIKKDTYLRLFGKEDTAITRKREEVPALFREYCIDRKSSLLCPKDFGCMEVGWYLNHSSNPNAYHSNYYYYALRDIKKGEEITIDYNALGEPEEFREDYYN